MRFKLKHAALAALALITSGILATSGSIGPHIGPRTGPTIGPTIGQHSAIPLILLFGDSQIVGESTTDTADPAFNVAATQSTTFVHFDKHFALSAGDPITYQTDISGGVQPWTIGGTPGLGMEISMGQTLTSTGTRSVLAAFGIFGMSVAQSVPTSTYPTLPPAGPNVFAQVVARTHALEATYGAKTAAALISDDGNDGANATDAGNVTANNAALAAALRSAFPGIKLLWIKINADTVNAAGFTEMSTAIANQATSFTNDAAIIPIYNDDCSLLSDHAHFNSDTADVVGRRAAFAALDAIGVPRQRPTTFPAVVGFGPEDFGTGDTHPHSWGGTQAGDLEILTSVTLTAAGTNNALTTPSGWTLIDTTSSTSGGSTIRAGYYRRAVDSTMIAANHGNTAATTVAGVNSDNFAAIITIRGPSATVPTVEASQLSVNNAFSTSGTWTGVTALGAGREAVEITVGFRTNATANPVTLTGSNLSGITLVRNGTRNSGLGNYATIDVQAAPAGAGPTGNFTAALALNSIAIGAVLSIAP